jgi:hypothetical protein
VGVWMRMLVLAGDHFNADSAVTDEAARAVEHRLAAHPKLLLRAISIDAVEEKIEEGLPGGNGRLQHRPLGLVPARPRTSAVRQAGADADAEHLQDRTRRPW